MLNLSGKNILVTGASKRTGRGIALKLAAHGATIAIHYQSSHKKAQEVVKLIETNQGKAFAFQARLQSPFAVKKMVEKINQKLGSIDILINNVGTFLLKNITEISPKEWEYALSTTVTTTFLTCNAILPGMVKRQFGRIINISDAGADHLRSVPNLTPYMIGKTGILILSKSLSEVYAKYGITINCISPGILDNSITKPSKGIKSIPVQRFATINDITNSILFLLDKNSSYINGANIKVGGGWQA